MQIILLIIVEVLILMEIYNYAKNKSLEKRTEMTFIEVEKSLNMLERGIKNANR